MNEMTAAGEATVPAPEVVLPGKVEPSGLRLVQRALAAPAAGQALVRVESTAVSFAESAMRRGRYSGPPPLPLVPRPAHVRDEVAGRPSGVTAPDRRRRDATSHACSAAL